MSELRNLTLEKRLTCPNGHTNSGKGRNEWRIFPLENEITMKLENKRGMDKKLIDCYGEGAVIQFKYHCNACNRIFGIDYKGQSKGDNHDNY